MAKKIRITALLLAVICLFAGCQKKNIDVAAKLQQGEELINSMQYMEAIKVYKEVAKADAQSEKAYRGMINAYTLLGAAEGNDYAEELFGCYKNLYNTRSCNAEELLVLGEMYREKGDVIKYRTLAEQALRLTPNAETLEKVNTIVADVAFDSVDIQTKASDIALLFSESNIDAVIEMLYTNEWYEIMAPGIENGHRRYVYGVNSDRLYIEVGYSPENVRYTSLWYAKNGKDCTYLKAEEARIIYAKTSLNEGKYNGGFESFLIDGATRQIFCTTGNFNADVLTESITALLSTADSDIPLTDMWLNRSAFASKAYSGSFDANGHAIAEQRAEITAGNAVIYAYAEGGMEFLFVKNVAVPANEYVFNSESLLIEEFPSWQIE